jgi:hypothetical protein
MNYCEIADEAWLRARGYGPIPGHATHWRRKQSGKAQVCAYPGVSTRHHVVTQVGWACHPDQR